MCGIAGIWNLDGAPVASGTIERYMRALAHRGPDGEGYYYDPAAGLALGHRRLAILDLTAAGQQPMTDERQRYWITFNGEIYNFLELRQELEAFGYHFHTETDTEVIIAAYDRWGAGCQLRFNGMWAFAIWDRQERRLFISRDRFGIKPLFYLAEPRRFAFASELKAFLHLDGYTPRENTETMRRILANVFARGQTGETLLQGVELLFPGCCLEVTRDRSMAWCWWRTLDHVQRPPSSLAAQGEEFRHLFADSCRLRLRSDVPVATCLSGGLDSSAVLCMLAEIRRGATAVASERLAADWQRAFVATFPGTPVDERAYAEIAVRYAGARARYKAMSGDLALEELTQLIYDFEDVYLTLPYPAWSIYRELRRDHVVVSLDGHGSDEMLGGYRNHVEEALKSTGGLFASPWRAAELLDAYRYLRQPDQSRALSSSWALAVEHDPILRQCQRVLLGVYRRTLGRRSLRQPPAAAGAQAWLRFTPPPQPELDPHEQAQVGSLSPVNQLLYREFHHTVLPTILRNFDRCSMAHGVEVRMPFLDWRLVRFVFSLPDRSKIGQGFTKLVLRQAMRGLMPDELRLRRSKIGFCSPLADWLRGSLNTWAVDQVRSREFLESDLWNGPQLSAFITERCRAKVWTAADAKLVWPFLHAHLWRTAFLAKGGAR